MNFVPLSASFATRRPRTQGADFGTPCATLREQFVSAQGGSRSANAVYGEAILLALRDGPISTTILAPRVQALLPDLCDDNEELVINGERFGKAWKHNLRNAQQSLKRRGLIAYDGSGRVWSLTARTQASQQASAYQNPAL